MMMNGTEASIDENHQWQSVLIILTCGIIILGTIVGNVLVCTAVAIVKKLRTPSNLLIVSLAVSDLLVALLVMPLATGYEATGEWVLGQALCDMYTSLDVMLCTASILNLCIISVDRYFVITRPFQYAMKRTPVRMTVMIVGVWVLSALISVPPLFSGSWKAKVVDGKCLLSNDPSYQLYATIGAFYLPLTVMIIIYYRIYMVSSRIAQAEARSKPNGLDPTVNSASIHSPPLHYAATVTQSPVHTEKSEREMEKGKTESGEVTFQNDLEKYQMLETNKSSTVQPEVNKSVNGSTVAAGSGEYHKQQVVRCASSKRYNPRKVVAAAMNRKRPLSKDSSKKSPKSSHALNNECKATKTLGIIMGAFTACWLPFFILALVKSFCAVTLDPHCIPAWLGSLFQWLGYANSFLNPIIYARFNREFRTPFRDILLLRCRGINSRLRTESYVEQYGMSGVGRSSRGQGQEKQSSATKTKYDSINIGMSGQIDPVISEKRNNIAPVDTIVQYHELEDNQIVLKLEDHDNKNSNCCVTTPPSLAPGNGSTCILAL